MGDEDGSFELPEGISESELLEIVRELIGDGDMTDDELRNAYKSGMFQELCPDIAKYAQQRSGGSKSNVYTETSCSSKDVKIKTEKDDYPSHYNVKVESKLPSHRNEAIKGIKVEVDKDSESDSDSHVASHKKKKKKKHKKDKRKDGEKDERKEKDSSTKEKPKIKLSDADRPKISIKDLKQESSSDSEATRQKPIKKEKEKHGQKKIIRYFSSSSESEDEKRKPMVTSVKKEVIVLDNDSKCDGPAIKKVKTENEEKSKIHPFFMEKKPPESDSAQPSTSVKVEDKKKEPKPFSKYNGSVSKVNLKRWKPALDRDHLRYQRKFRLKPVSITCVDLLDLPMIFHHPKKRSKNPNAIPLASGLELSTTRRDMIRRLERDKLSWFRKKLNKQALRFMKHSKRNLDASDDDKKPPKRVRIMDRIYSDSDSNDSSSITYPNRKPSKSTNDQKEKGKGKMTKAEKEADAKRRKIEEMKRKVEKISKINIAGKTRKLDWESKDNYFKNKGKVDPAKEKEKAVAEKRKRQEQLRKERLEQQKHAPSVSFQRILAQIDAANKVEASKPTVELKIPKKSQQPQRPPTEYKLEKKISVGDVAKEVTRLLSSNVNVECPIIPENVDDLGEYTVKKIAWWILKNEKDPADEVLIHPECHDNDKESWNDEEDFDWPSDMSSVNGCVSDPEGIGADVPHDPAKLNDPDWHDEYCGEASLYAKIRRRVTKDNYESFDDFWRFFKIKPGTNYTKPNFVAKCFICDTHVSSQRQLGAHIRSDSHKNSFRNESLKKADYEEKVVKVAPKKEFIAKLVEYSVNPNPISTSTITNSVKGRTDNADDMNLHHVGKIERVRSDSPGPVIDGDAKANIEVHEMPIPDDISLPSIEDYDISSDESLMNVKVVIRTSGKWNDDLEKRWRTWKDEEAKIAEIYNEERELFINEPQRHPDYEEEWMNFWERRCAELDAEGVDPDTYDFQKEWLAVWLKRMQEIMHAKVEEKVAELKRSLRIDKHTLRKMYGIPEAVTKRKKIKKKGKYKMAATNSGSIKSSDQMESTDHQQQYMAEATPKPYPYNNVPIKPSYLPTPPGTNDDGRIKNRYMNDSIGRKPNFRSKSPNHSNERDVPYSNHIDNGNGNVAYDIPSTDPNVFASSISNIKKPNSKISCDEPPPPGEENVGRRPISQTPLTSELVPASHDRKNLQTDSKERKVSLSERPDDKRKGIHRDDKHNRYKFDKDDRRRDRDDYRRDDRNRGGDHRRDERNRRDEHKRDKDDRCRRDKDDRRRTEDERRKVKDERRHDDSPRKRDKDEPRRRRSKHSRSRSDNSEDESSQQKRLSKDSDQGSSTSSNTRTLKERLKALREALANEEVAASGGQSLSIINPTKELKNTVASNDGPSQIDSLKHPLTPEDGEVASDISSEDLNLNPEQGMSTFINKDLPGLHNFETDGRPGFSRDGLDNSLGRRLLERSLSTDKPVSSFNSESRPKIIKQREEERKHFKKKKKFEKHFKPSWHNDDRNRHNDRRNSHDHDSKHNKRDRHQGGHKGTSFQRHDNTPVANHFTNNAAPSAAVSNFHEDSWDTNDNWNSSRNPVAPQYTPGTSAVAGPSHPPQFTPGPVPLLQGQVPEYGNHIPVLGQPRMHQTPPYNPHHQVQPWAEGWNNNNSNYNPYMTDNNYYQ